jgi:hypothetical protein
VRGFAAHASLPARVRIALERTPASREALRAAARAHLAIGLHLFDRREIDRALALLGTEPAADRSDATRLELALALALHGGPRDMGEWTREPPSWGKLDVAALDAVGATAAGPAPSVARYDARLLRDLQMEEGPVAGELAPLEEQLRGYEALSGDPHVGGSSRERADPIRFLLKQIAKDAVEGPYAANTRVRFAGWPRVRVGGGSWRAARAGMTRIGIANRTGSVNRALRRLSYRFEPCFAAAAAAHTTLTKAVALRFSIARDGTVVDAEARADAPDGADLARCVAKVAQGIWFAQPNGGVWRVDVVLRANDPPVR